jgi:hypothetical protein
MSSLLQEKIEHMEVDPIRGASMRINFDVTFPSMPCAVLSLDAMDVSGQHQLDVLHNIFKRRLDMYVTGNLSPLILVSCNNGVPCAEPVRPSARRSGTTSAAR